MEAKNIEEYLRILLEVQKERYIQINLLEKLNDERDSLCIRRKIYPPERETVGNDYGTNMGATGVVCGVIIAFIVAIIAIVSLWKSSPLIALFAAVVCGIASGLIGGFLSSLIIGPIVAAASGHSEQKKADSYYEAQYKEYEIMVVNQNKRLEQELVERNYIDGQINLLKRQIKETDNFLEELYNDTGIIDPIYHFNMVATASFYQYFRSKRTYSLGFNPSTGDEGAYNIYEKELRMNTIIGKLDVIIEKLDQISANQRVLFDCLNDANKKMDTINTNILMSASQINSNIEKHSEMEQYNAEIMQEQLDYRNIMDSIFRWK